MTLHLPPVAQKPPKTGQGFSLIELLAVLAVLAIVAALAAPNIRQMVLNNRIKSAAGSLFTALQLVRSEAIARNKKVRFCPSNQSGTGCENTDAFKYGLLLTAANSDGSNTTLYRTENMPDGVTISSDKFKDEQWFKSSGIASAEGSILVTGNSDINYRICIGKLGQITLKEGKKDETSCTT